MNISMLQCGYDITEIIICVSAHLYERFDL